MNINTASRLYNDVVNPTSSVTAIQLGSSQNLRFGVTIYASSSNTQTLYCGNSGVTTSNGFPISAGGVLNVPVDNLNKIYLIGSGSVRYIGG